MLLTSPYSGILPFSTLAKIMDSWFFSFKKSVKGGHFRERRFLVPCSRALALSLSLPLSLPFAPSLCVQVVGPPGTGKTDVAVQIISNIYHNFPEQRTLIVTHCNQV